MPVEGLTARYRELGRLKFGEDLGDRPAQLRTWRLVSPDVTLIEAAASLYGGEPRITEGGAEVITTTAALPVLIPTQDIATGQWYELWTAGGLQRRCSGASTVRVASDGESWETTGPCLCDPTARECRLQTVLRVILPELPDLGVWRLTTRSLYAAAELPTSVAAISQLTGEVLAPAILALEERSTKKPGRGRQAFIVPVVRTESSLAELTAPTRPALDYGPTSPEAGPTEAPQLPMDTPPPAQNPTTAPESPQDSPEDSPGPVSRPKPATANLVEPAWETLARFLAETDPGQLPHQTDPLIEALSALEALMVKAGLWAGDSLGASAARHLGDPAWRDSQHMTATLRAFVVRAFLDAAHRFDSDPRGPIAAHRVKETTP